MGLDFGIWVLGFGIWDLGFGFFKHSFPAPAIHPSKGWNPYKL